MKLQGLSALEREKLQAKTLEEKIALAKAVIRAGCQRFSPERMAVAWTGGKDSTLTLWLVREVCKTDGWRLPRIMFVDEGDVFPEVWEFVRDLVEEWKLDFHIAHNEDVSSKAKKIGDPIKVCELNERNRKEIARLGYQEETFPYEPESFVGNHLMKTVATNIWLEEHGVEVLVTGVRWDEQEARARDDFLRELQNPHHWRLEPILHFLERDIWEATHKNRIPYVKLYEEGYRSLGARVTTQKVSNKPAWEQDLENTTEREGRRQDKEKIMERLRELGYM